MASSSDAAAFGAFRDGISRVNAAPAVLAGVCVLTLFVALPLSLTLRGMLEAHLGSSLEAVQAESGTNYDWWQEFSAQASGLGVTFAPTIIGFGAVLENVSALADNLPMVTAVAGAIGVWMVLWSFVSGGILDRYARQRPIRAHGFFTAAGGLFWRILRLGILAFLTYYVLFALLHGLLLDDLHEWATRDLSVERSAFFVRAGLYAAFGLVLAAINIAFDYARVRLVVEDRRSALGALLAGARFVRRHPGSIPLYALNTATFLLLGLAYALLSPGAPTNGLAMWATLALGQLYIIGRHYVKLLFYASEVAFFQASLAHAAYTAAPAIEWPESPAAEAILNADAIGR
jgi:hypothetical protein